MPVLSETLLPPLDLAAPPTQLVAAALAHLATHMQTRCPRSAALAVMLLELIAEDERADAHLRAHARQLADVIERDPQLIAAARDAAVAAPGDERRLPASGGCPVSADGGRR